MNYIFEVHKISGVVLLFYKNRDGNVEVITNTGDYFGSFLSVGSAMKIIRANKFPLCKKYIFTAELRKI